MPTHRAIQLHCDDDYHYLTSRRHRKAFGSYPHWSGTSSDEEALEEADTIQDWKLLRKVDLRLLPILTLLYLLSFLDRTNIGNAKIDGLTKDLHVSPAAYNTALALYFIAYVSFEVPANIVFGCLSLLSHGVLRLSPKAS